MLQPGFDPSHSFLFCYILKYLRIATIDDPSIEVFRIYNGTEMSTLVLPGGRNAKSRTVSIKQNRPDSRIHTQH
jgi:hypothetical protein